LRGIRSPASDVKAELAYTYQLAGKPEETAKLYTEAAEAAPQDLNLQLSAAQAQLGAGSLGTAENFLKRAEALDAHHYRLLAIRGELANAEEQPQDALRDYDAALANLPGAIPEGELYPIQLRMDVVQLEQKLGDEAAFKSQLAIAQQQIGALKITGHGKEDFLRLRAMIKLLLVTRMGRCRT